MRIFLLFFLLFFSLSLKSDEITDFESLSLTSTGNSVASETNKINKEVTESDVWANR